MALSPLDQLHRAAGASFTDFAGWDMPVRYSSDLAEHHAVRERSGLFDISHMAEFRIEGADAGAYLDYVLAGVLSKLALGQAKYSLLLSETGGVIDDLIVYRLGTTEFLIIANAGNRFPVAEALAARIGGFDVSVSDESDETALIAIQGPTAEGILRRVPGLVAEAFAEGEPPAPDALSALGYYRCLAGRFGETPVLFARTGYTGEDGFEIALPNAAAAALWSALLEVGGDDVHACGLAARDTLRLEAGMPLYGHELGLQWRPEQAGLGRVVAMSKTDEFVGKSALSNPVDPDAHVLVGLVSEGKRAGRAGYPVLAGDEIVGEVTSGALSPTLGYPIAMAMVHPSVSAIGTELELDVRGTRIPAVVTALPFYSRSARN
ncbi:MAG TPA: glycine cleavage system aminomethyltransferase GcvT [Microbacteriaceae bacterium]|nr:glycine cleavage system aminomethyltransferase GcvT [Microbacteriaceae bacterium]